MQNKVNSRAENTGCTNRWKNKTGNVVQTAHFDKNEKFCLTAGLAGVTMWTNQNHGNGAGQVHPARRFCYLSASGLMRQEKIEEAPWFDLERSGLNMYNSSTVIWVLVAAFLVYFMQAGFALCEAGLTRAKNTGNILMKNMMDFCIGTPCFWLVVFGIMFAGSGPPSCRRACPFGFMPCSRPCSVQRQQPLFPAPWQSVPSSALTAATRPLSA